MPINPLQIQDCLPASKESTAAIVGGILFTSTTAVLLIIVASQLPVGLVGFTLLSVAEGGSFILFLTGICLHARKKAQKQLQNTLQCQPVPLTHMTPPVRQGVLAKPTATRDQKPPSPPPRQPLCPPPSTNTRHPTPQTPPALVSQPATTTIHPEPQQLSSPPPTPNLTPTKAHTPVSQPTTTPTLPNSQQPLYSPPPPQAPPAPVSQPTTTPFPPEPQVPPCPPPPTLVPNLTPTEPPTPISQPTIIPPSPPTTPDDYSQEQQAPEPTKELAHLPKASPILADNSINFPIASSVEKEQPQKLLPPLKYTPPPTSITPPPAAPAEAPPATDHWIITPLSSPPLDQFEEPPPLPPSHKEEKEKEAELPTAAAPLAEPPPPPKEKEPFSLPTIPGERKSYIQDVYQQISNLFNSAEQTLIAFCKAYHQNQTPIFMVYNPEKAAKSDEKKIREAFAVFKHLLKVFLAPSPGQGMHLFQAILSIVGGALETDLITDVMNEIELLPRLTACCEAFQNNKTKEGLKTALKAAHPYQSFDEAGLNHLMDKLETTLFDRAVQDSLAKFFASAEYTIRSRNDSIGQVCCAAWVKYMQAIAQRAKLTKEESILFFQLTLPSRVDPVALKLLPFEVAFNRFISVMFDQCEKNLPLHQMQTALQRCCQAFRSWHGTQLKDNLIKMHPELESRSEEISALIVKIRYSLPRRTFTTLSLLSIDKASLDHNLKGWIAALESTATKSNLDEKEKELLFQLALPPFVDRSTGTFKEVSFEEFIEYTLSENEQAVDPVLKDEIKQVVIMIRQVVSAFAKAPLSSTSGTLLVACRKRYHAWATDKEQKKEGESSVSLELAMRTAFIHFLQQRAVESKISPKLLSECTETILPRLFQIASMAICGELKLDDQKEDVDKIDLDRAIQAIREEYGENEQANEKALEEKLKEALGDKLAKLTKGGITVLTSVTAIETILKWFAFPYFKQGMDVLPLDSQQKQSLEKALKDIIIVVTGPLLYGKFKQGSFHDQIKKVVDSRLFYPRKINGSGWEAIIQAITGTLSVLQHLVTDTPFSFQTELEAALKTCLPPPPARQKGDFTVSFEDKKYPFTRSILFKQSNYFSASEHFKEGVANEFDLNAPDLPRATPLVLQYLQGRLKDTQIESMPSEEISSLLEAATFFDVRRLELITQRILITRILNNELDLYEEPQEFSARGWNFLAACQALVYEPDYKKALQKKLSRLSAPQPPQEPDFEIVLKRGEDQTKLLFTRKTLEAHATYFTGLASLKEGVENSLILDLSLVPEQTPLVMQYLLGNLSDEQLKGYGPEQLVQLLEAASFFSVKRLELLTQKILISLLINKEFELSAPPEELESHGWHFLAACQLAQSGMALA